MYRPVYTVLAVALLAGCEPTAIETQVSRTTGVAAAPLSGTTTISATVKDGDTWSDDTMPGFQMVVAPGTFTTPVVLKVSYDSAAKSLSITSRDDAIFKKDLVVDLPTAMRPEAAVTNDRIAVTLSPTGGSAGEQSLTFDRSGGFRVALATWGVVHVAVSEGTQGTPEPTVTPPTAVVTPALAALTAVGPLSLTVAGTNVAAYKFALVDTSSCNIAAYGAWMPAATALTVTVPAPGTYSICVLARDAAGHEQTIATKLTSAFDRVWSGTIETAAHAPQSMRVRVTAATDADRSLSIKLTQGTESHELAVTSDDWQIIDGLTPNITYQVAIQGLTTIDAPTSVTARTLATTEVFADATTYTACYAHTRLVKTNPVTGRLVIAGHGTTAACYGEYDGTTWSHVTVSDQVGAVGYWIYENLEFDATGRAWMTSGNHTADANARIRVWSCADDCLAAASWTKSIEFIDSAGSGSAGLSLQVGKTGTGRVVIGYDDTASGGQRIRECYDVDACAAGTGWTSGYNIVGAQGWSTSLALLGDGTLILYDSGSSYDGTPWVHVCKTAPCTTDARWLHGRLSNISLYGGSGIRTEQRGTKISIAAYTRDRSEVNVGSAAQRLYVATCDTAVSTDCFTLTGGVYAQFTGETSAFSFTAQSGHGYGPPPYFTESGMFYSYQFDGDTKAYWRRCTSNCSTSTNWSAASLHHADATAWIMYGVRDLAAFDGDVYGVPLTTGLAFPEL